MTLAYSCPDVHLISGELDITLVKIHSADLILFFKQIIVALALSALYHSLH